MSPLTNPGMVVARCSYGGTLTIDRTHASFRCHTLRLVRTVQGDLKRGTQGTVLYEIEHLGRRLVLVHWDMGITVPVFPDEIELEGADCRQGGVA